MDKYKEHRVTSLPTENLKAGDKYYLLLEDNSFKTYIVDNNLNLIGESEPDRYIPISEDDYFDI